MRTEHEVLAELLRLELGKRTSEVGVTEREAEVLSDEAKNAQQQVHTAGGLDDNFDSGVRKQMMCMAAWLTAFRK